jgi:NADH-quinone oxidoreductase subunit J
MGLTIAFWILAVVAVLAGIMVVSLKNVFRAALALILCFLTVAGIYITLSADFLAAVQILVYVGAISVLIILAIMMTRDVQHANRNNRLTVPVFITAAVVLGVMVWTVVKTNWQISTVNPTFPTTLPLADKLFSQNGYILPVEVGAMLILAAILGAIVIAREK